MGSAPGDDSHGFQEECLARGAHICQIFTHELERLDTLVDFIGNGLRLGERTCCFSDQPAEGLVQEFLAGRGISLTGARSAGQVLAGRSRDFYLGGGSFDQERLFAQWCRFHGEARARGFTGIRALGELAPELERLGLGPAVIRYETRLNALFQRCPPTRALCQYDARAFGGCTLMGVLEAHPLVLVDRRVHPNPFYRAGGWAPR